MKRLSFIILFVLALLQRGQAQTTDSAIQYRLIPDTSYFPFLYTIAMEDLDLAKVSGWGVDPSKLKQIRKYLPDSVTLLEYIPLRNSLLIFVIDKNFAHIVEVDISRNALAVKAKNLLNAASYQNMPEGMRAVKIRGLKVKTEKNQHDLSLTAISTNLFSCLIQPVSSLLEGKKYISIAAYGPLINIPFQLLSRPADTGGISRFLIEEYSFFYINDLSTFQFATEKSAAGNLMSIKAFGNPDGSLPNSEKEVNAIKKLYPSTQVFTKEKANMDMLLKMKFTNSILHFATHGVIDPSDSRKSYLVLSEKPGDTARGRLTIGEIFEINLDGVNMIVLSACNTGVSFNTDSLQLGSSMSKLMNIAGIRTIIASLWPVDDAASSLLMTEFYRNLATLPAVEALRYAQASVSLNPKYLHPYFWAGFILIGYWK